MKVAVSSTGKELNAQMDPRFGRCACFIIVDTDDMQFIAYDNEDKALIGGAGIQAAGFVVSKGAKAVLTGNCGPNAMKAFSAAGVTVHTGQTGTVGEAVQRFRTGNLTPSTRATVPEKAGILANTGTDLFPGKGTGRCRGGSGRGMGMGGGRGMRQGSGASLSGSGDPVMPAVSREDLLADLKRQAQELQRQMAAIQTRIDQVK